MRCICLVDGICYTACEYGVVFFYGLKQKLAYMVYAERMNKSIVGSRGKNRGSIGLFYMLQSLETGCINNLLTITFRNKYLFVYSIGKQFHCVR